MATKKKEEEVARYSKAQILGADSIEHSRDVMQILLKDTEYYTLEEVDKIVKAFLKRKVD